MGLDCMENSRISINGLLVSKWGDNQCPFTLFLGKGLYWPIFFDIRKNKEANKSLDFYALYNSPLLFSLNQT